MSESNWPNGEVRKKRKAGKPLPGAALLWGAKTRVPPGNLSFCDRGPSFRHPQVLRANKVWDRDVFLWLPVGAGQFIKVLYEIVASCDLNPEPVPLRAHYYTSVQGDDDRINATRESLRHLGFHPSVFKKSKGGRSKGVDITLAR